MSVRSFVRRIESAEGAEIAYCAVGYEIFRFARVKRMILSDRWSDSNEIKESDFAFRTLKDHLLLFPTVTFLDKHACEQIP